MKAEFFNSETFFPKHQFVIKASDILSQSAPSFKKSTGDYISEINTQLGLEWPRD